jgi:hypothetical protein
MAPLYAPSKTQRLLDHQEVLLLLQETILQTQRILLLKEEEKGNKGAGTAGEDAISASNSQRNSEPLNGQGAYERSVATEVRIAIGSAKVMPYGQRRLIRNRIKT